MLFGAFHRWYDGLAETSRFLTFVLLMLVCLAMPLLVSITFSLGQTVYQVLQLVGWCIMIALGLDRAAWINRQK
jgi:hypothetical protein